MQNRVGRSLPAGNTIGIGLRLPTSFQMRVFMAVALLALLSSRAAAQSCTPPSVFATPVLSSPGVCPLIVDTLIAGSTNAVAVGDFNRDGKLDVAMAQDGDNDELAVLLGNGDGTFQSPIYINPCCNPADFRSARWVVVGDFNGDGVPDIVAGTSNGWVTILTGKGDGTFNLAQYW